MSRTFKGEITKLEAIKNKNYVAHGKILSSLSNSEVAFIVDTDEIHERIIAYKEMFERVILVMNNNFCVTQVG